MGNTIVSWSGGKDSAFALYSLLQKQKYTVSGLFSTTSQKNQRLPAHEVRMELIREQANSIQLPLYEVTLPEKPRNEEYEQLVGEQLLQFKEEGIETISYADLLLEDMKVYRDQLLKRYGMRGLYPLWKKDTLQAAKDFLSHGFHAIVTTVDAAKLPEDMVGRIFDEAFIRSLPKDVDPSGENGEFHTFVFDGPIFSYPIKVEMDDRFETEAYGNRFIHAEIKRSST